jgi:hypothetical protein
MEKVEEDSKTLLLKYIASVDYPVPKEEIKTQKIENVDTTLKKLVESGEL